MYTKFSGVCAALAAIGIASAQPPLGTKPDHSAACLQPGAWHIIDHGPPRVTAEGKLLAAMAQRGVVLLGEQHDEPADHQWELQTLAALHVLHPDMVIGFEAFPRRTQPVLDKWVAGELSVKRFLADVVWEKIWNLPPELYVPLFQFARINRIPMVALNIDRSLTESIAKLGWDAVPEGKKEGVSRPAPAGDAYRAYLAEVFRQHERGAAKTGEDATGAALQHFIESQLTWDRAMAQALAARSAADGSAPLVVGIMGSGHVRYGYGVPHQLRDLGITNIGTLIPVSATSGCADLKGDYADAIFAIPRYPAEQPPPPRLGVRLEAADRGVRITEVMAGSLAERTGLKAGDRVLKMAGRRIAGTADVIGAVRAQPAGTWLPVTLQRGGDTLERVIKFPPQE